MAGSDSANETFAPRLTALSLSLEIAGAVVSSRAEPSGAGVVVPGVAVGVALTVGRGEAVGDAVGEAVPVGVAVTEGVGVGVTGEPLTVTVPVITACTLQANV